MKCPVSEYEYSGRTDHVKRHFSKLILWSKTYEDEAAEESENSNLLCNSNLLAWQQNPVFINIINLYHNFRKR